VRMPVTQYFGHPARYHGKPLFHILCNLSQFGKGRIVTRSSYQAERQPGELPSFFRILWAQPLMEPSTLQGRVVAERVRKGVVYTEPVDLADVAPVPDFILIPRAEEQQYCQWEALRQFNAEGEDQVTEPAHFTLPPLLRLLMERAGGGAEPGLLPHHKTVQPKNVELVDMGRGGGRPRRLLHQETTTKCEGVASYSYGHRVEAGLSCSDPAPVLARLPSEPPMPNPAVGMRLYRWPDNTRNHKEERRTEEHNTYFP